jgi:ABC-type lipopolysaccharide export system ATPase subunit
VVVTRNRSEHGLGQFLTRASVFENLDVEDQVHPQDGEQKSTACRE